MQESNPQLPQGDAKRIAVKSIFDRIAKRYNRVNRIITFGLDIYWRKKTVADLELPTGSVVMDLACGTADLCREISRASMIPMGVDLSMGMLLAARTDAPLLQGDLLALPLADQSADGAVCGFALRNLVDLNVFFAELARIVRPNGRIALLDASEPENKILRFGHRIYFQTIVPRIGALLSDKEAYAYLPKSLAYLPPWQELKQQLHKSGFTNIRRRTFVGAQLISATLGRSAYADKAIPAAIANPETS